MIERPDVELLLLAVAAALKGGVLDALRHKDSSLADRGATDLEGAEASPTETGSTQLGSTQLGSTQLGSTQLGSTQLGSTELESADRLASERARYLVRVAANIVEIVARELAADPDDAAQDHRALAEFLRRQVGADSLDSLDDPATLATSLDGWIARSRAGLSPQALRELSALLADDVARRVEVARPGYATGA